MHKKVNVRIGLFFLIVFCLLLSSVFLSKNINIPNVFLKDGILAANKFVGKFTHSFNRDYNDLLSENEQLKQEIGIYKTYQDEVLELKAQIDKLKEVVNINSLLSDKEYINGSVINRDFSYWQEKLIIDVGSNDGIENNMAVISNGGLIGITDDVGGNYSSVLLLCNSGFPMNVSVKINTGDSYVYGILNHYDNDTQSFEVVGVVENVDIPNGSLVVTTGLGNIFPSGVVVGYVTDVLTDNFDLSKVISVKPDVSFDDIHYVTVVKREDK